MKNKIISTGTPRERHAYKCMTIACQEKRMKLRSDLKMPEKEDKRLSVIIYSRVASREVAGAEDRITGQKERLMEYCNSKGRNVVGCFEEYASGKCETRPEFNRMIEFIKKHKGLVQKLVITDLSRFSRDFNEYHKMSRRLTKMGVEVESVNQPEEFNGVTNLIALRFCIMENNLRIERIKAGIQVAKARKNQNNS